MAITYNGTSITNWTYNAVTGTVTYNGTQIWPEATTKTGVYITTHSSQGGGDYAIPGCPDINGEGSLTPPLIEAVYPASGLPVGTSGTVYCSNAYGTGGYELEVQLV